MSAKIGVLTGLRSEADILLEADADVMVEVSAARPEHAARAVIRLIEAGCAGLVSFGTAGGMSPDARPGCVYTATHVVTEGFRHATDPGWTAAIEAATGARGGKVFGSDKMLSSADKERLYGQLGTPIADMESHIVAEAASGAGLPFAVLRCVVDPRELDVPAWTMDVIDESGGVRLIPALSGVMRHPESLPAVVRLGRYNKLALAELRRAASALGRGLGFFAR